MLPWFEGNEKNIAVIGDIILDEYLDGLVERISPEAPVPILAVKNTTFAPGGAANTARSLQLAGARTWLFGVWGEDEAAAVLRKTLASDGVDLNGVVVDKSRPTIKKTRICSGHQQMMRVDWELPVQISDEIEQRIFKMIKETKFDGVLVSDYGKGVLSHSFLKALFEYTRRLNIPCIVDPKGKDFGKYQGCHLITPNRLEACQALGLSANSSKSGLELASELKVKFNLDEVLITMGAQGMLYLPAQGAEHFIHKTPRAREVFDVSGAGDTVAAMMTLCVSSGLPTDLALDIANMAAGLVVEKWGTYALTRRELESAWASSEAAKKPKNSLESEKIISKDALVNIREDIKKKGKTLVFTNGCFDLLHAGHLSYLQKAKDLGDYLVVAVNSDSSVRNLKGPTRPIVPLQQRMKLLSGLACIDFVISFSELDPGSLIDCVLPDVLVKGEDYEAEKIVGYKTVVDNGGSVQTLCFLEGLSTSDIVTKIKGN